jgi:hypothetical protein
VTGKDRLEGRERTHTKLQVHVYFGIAKQIFQKGRHFQIDDLWYFHFKANLDLLVLRPNVDLRHRNFFNLLHQRESTFVGRFEFENNESFP